MADRTVTINGVAIPLTMALGGVQGVAETLADVSVSALQGGVIVFSTALPVPANSGEQWNAQSIASILGGPGAAWNAFHIYPSSLAVQTPTPQQLDLYKIEQPTITGPVSGIVSTFTIAGPPIVPAGSPADPVALNIQSGNLMLNTGAIEMGITTDVQPDLSDNGFGALSFNSTALQISINGSGWFSLPTFDANVLRAQFSDLQRKFRLLLKQMYSLGYSPLIGPALLSSELPNALATS